MKSILTKRVIIITSIVMVLAITAVLVAFATGNTTFPELSNPDDVYYQRLDDDGNVVYTITNEELFEEIKSNDGIEQLLLLTDTVILKDYLDAVTDEEIAEKRLELTYGTSDLDEIAEYSDEIQAEALASYNETMELGGYGDNDEEYISLLLAREAFAYEYADENEYISEYDVIDEYLNGYFEDVSAIKIRFTSSTDAKNVMNEFNLLTLSSLELRTYNGYTYADTSLEDDYGVIVDAYKPVVAYYFDEDGNILNTDNETIFTLGTNDIYTDEDDVEYYLDESDNLVIQDTDEIYVNSTYIFDTIAKAENYETDNIAYYTISKVDPFDDTEDAVVTDESDNVVYTIKSDGHLYDLLDNDVTESSDIIINKTYEDIEDISTADSYNSSSMTDEEILVKYIQMYNYVYGGYRDLLAEDATVEELAALDNDFLHFNYETVSETSTAIAEYLFVDLSLDEDSGTLYSPEAIALVDNSNTYYYMMYKLTEPEKVDILDTIYNSLEALVVIPTEIADDVTLPTSTYYDATIAWSSEDASIITSSGVVYNPDEDTEVEMTYTITVFGESRSFDTTVTVLAEGDTEEVTETDWEEVSVKTILDDDALYNTLYDQLINEYLEESDGDNIDTILEANRTELGFNIYDKYLGMDYQLLDTDFEYDSKGDKEIICSFDNTLTSDEAYTVTADELFEYALAKTPALYTLYATQEKELFYSEYFTNLFGDEMNLYKNDSERIEEMFTSLTNSKSEYAYYQSLYENMGSDFGYESYSDYAYARYGTKTEYETLEYFVMSELQPYLIQEVIDAEDVIDLLEPSMEDYYNNYFSLDVEHILVYLDYDEDGMQDDYNEYVASLTGEDLTEFNALLGTLYNEINDSEDDFSTIVSDFNDAPRDDETWGAYKQYGFYILTESLNMYDDDDVEHSLNYSGDYGTKDTYVTEYTDKLIEMYNDYLDEQNLLKDELTDYVTTEFGFHYIKVEQGDDFDKPSAAFTEEDPDNPLYSEGVEVEGDENGDAMPTIEQMELYTLYTFYSLVYDLTDADIVEKYGLEEIPSIPTSVSNALEVYFGDILDEIYVMGTINFAIADRISNGEFLTCTYSDATNAELLTSLDEIYDLYYEAILGEYTVEAD